MNEVNGFCSALSALLLIPKKVSTMSSNFPNSNVFKLVQIKNIMNKWIEIFAGLIFVIAAVLMWYSQLWGFGDAALVFLKGGIMWLVIMIGLLFIMLGISDLKG